MPFQRGRVSLGLPHHSKDDEGRNHTKGKDVESRVAQYLVQHSAFSYLPHLGECSVVHHEICGGERQKLSICIVGKCTIDVDSNHDEDTDVAQCAVETLAVFLADVNNQRLLARLDVVVVVAIVVQNEQRIYYQSAGDGSQYGFC